MRGFDLGVHVPVLAASGHPRGDDADDQVPKEVVQERFDRLVSVQDAITSEGNRAQVGQTFEVLVEGASKKGPSTQARTRTNRIVHLDDAVTPGTFVHARITEAAAHHLRGVVVPAPVGAGV